MKNLCVIENFIRGMEAKGSHLVSTGIELINYSTVIAKKVNGIVYLSSRIYSKTTSVHQNRIRKEVKDFPLLTLREVDHECLN